MTRAARCCAGSDSRSRRTDQSGEEGADRQGEAEAQVRGARIHQVRALRAPACGVPEVRAVPDLLPDHGPPRRTAWHHQIELVTNIGTDKNLGARLARARRPNWAPPAPTDHAEGPAGETAVRRAIR